MAVIIVPTIINNEPSDIIAKTVIIA